MQHDDYVREQLDEDPALELSLVAARVVEAFDELLATGLEFLHMALDDLSEISGIEVERLQELLSGDSVLLEEVVLLCHALQFNLEVTQEFSLHTHWPMIQSAPAPRFSGHSVVGPEQRTQGQRGGAWRPKAIMPSPQLQTGIGRVPIVSGSS